eukprot:Unigene11051_Nuclearia_a/m.33798 Unigene11051_Nuclearia_a/g.33798  ORF Unigene11051_Nuclearia_a/g.33798 Unigene11051_Nuclearia_a/m.33798 type:complete len:243 (-) Unigene11051_Nuclearia_a:295-1023(-)
MDTVTVAVAVTLVAIAAWWLVPWPFDARRMRGWRVVVCGASTGLGEDIVYEYARAACEIAVVARTRELLERVAAKAEQLGATRVHVIEADLAGQDNCAAVVARAVAAFGGPFDVLVLNQLRPFYGVLHDDPAKFGEIEKIFAVNAFSYFYLALHALPHLTARDGRIVVNSSMTAKVPLPFVVPYGASKHAVEGFFCDLRVDIERTSKVSITIALIGQIDTPRGRNTLGRSLSHLHVSACPRR